MANRFTVKAIYADSPEAIGGELTLSVAGCENRDLAVWLAALRALPFYGDVRPLAVEVIEHTDVEIKVPAACVTLTVGVVR